jgi:hypothetical protein
MWFWRTSEVTHHFGMVFQITRKTTKAVSPLLKWHLRQNPAYKVGKSLPGGQQEVAPCFVHIPSYRFLDSLQLGQDPWPTQHAVQECVGSQIPTYLAFPIWTFI